MERQGTSDRLILSALLRTMDLRINDRRALSDDQITEFSRFWMRRSDDLQARIGRAEAKRRATAVNQFASRLRAIRSNCG